MLHSGTQRPNRIFCNKQSYQRMEWRPKATVGVSTFTRPAVFRNDQQGDPSHDPSHDQSHHGATWLSRVPKTLYSSIILLTNVNKLISLLDYTCLCLSLRLVLSQLCFSPFLSSLHVSLFYLRPLHLPSKHIDSPVDSASTCGHYCLRRLLHQPLPSFAFTPPHHVRTQTVCRLQD